MPTLNDNRFRHICVRLLKSLELLGEVGSLVLGDHNARCVVVPVMGVTLEVFHFIHLLTVLLHKGRWSEGCFR